VLVGRRVEVGAATVAVGDGSIGLDVAVAPLAIEVARGVCVGSLGAGVVVGQKGRGITVELMWSSRRMSSMMSGLTAGMTAYGQAR
jgi:hypothetical protein